MQQQHLSVRDILAGLEPAELAKLKRLADTAGVPAEVLLAAVLRRVLKSANMKRVLTDALKRALRDLGLGEAH